MKTFILTLRKSAGGITEDVRVEVDDDASLDEFFEDSVRIYGCAALQVREEEDIVPPEHTWHPGAIRD